MSLTVIPAASTDVTDTVYGPPIRKPLAKTEPLSAVVDVRDDPLRVSTTVTFAPANAVPSGPVTFTRIAEVVSCAMAGIDAIARRKTAKKLKITRNLGFIFIALPSYLIG
jgi:hypothetical protein